MNWPSTGGTPPTEGGKRGRPPLSRQATGVGGAIPNLSALSVSSRHTFGVTGTPFSARSAATAALRSPG